MPGTKVEEPQEITEPQATTETQEPQVDPIEERVAELIKALRITDPAAIEAARGGLVKAVVIEEKSWEGVRDAIAGAVGEYRSFRTITVSCPNGEVKVERSTIAGKRRNGSGNPNAGTSFQGITRMLTPELAAKYQVETEHKSTRALSHALAGKLGKEAPADNAVPRWLKANAKDVYEHIGSPAS